MRVSYTSEQKASELEAAIDKYIDFYNSRRITAKLDGMTIAEHRDMLAKNSRKASYPPVL